MKQALIIIFCWVSFLGQHAAADEGKAFSPVFVSLGSSCEVAHQFRSCGVRSRAYPFDWLLTLDPDGLVSLLRSDFESFLDKNHILLDGGSFFDTYYNMEFRHDLYGADSSFEEYLPTIQEKYERRIARFRKLGTYAGKVYFFRSAYPPHYPPLTTSHPECFAITSAQAKKLKDALSQLFPAMDFTLVIINYSEVPSENICGIDKVIEFKIGRDAPSLAHVIQMLKE